MVFEVKKQEASPNEFLLQVYSHPDSMSANRPRTELQADFCCQPKLSPKVEFSNPHQKGHIAFIAYRKKGNKPRNRNRPSRPLRVQDLDQLKFDVGELKDLLGSSAVGRFCSFCLSSKKQLKRA